MSYCIHFCIQTHPSSWKFVLSASLFSHLCMLTWCVRAAQSCVTHHQVGRPPLRLRPGVEDKAAYLQEKKAREETTWDHRNTLRAVCIYSSVVIPLSAEDICPWSVRHVPIELLLSGLCGLWQKKKRKGKRTMSLCWKCVKEFEVYFSICCRKMMKK